MAPEFNAHDDIGDLAAAFVRAGAVVIRDFAPLDLLEDLRAGLAAAMCAALRQLGAPPASTDIDALFSTLSATSPSHASTLLTLGRDLPAFFSLVGWFAGQPHVRALAGSDHLQAPSDLCLLRVDAPYADETGFDWHQDYPYNMLARTAVTVWAPLTPVTAEMGLLQLILGSQAELLPVSIQRTARGRHQSQRQVEIAGLAERVAEYRRRAVELQPLSPGDVLVFHSHLLHCSGANRSARNRWVFNARFGDILDPELIARRWHTTRVKYPHVVAEIHPELVRWTDRDSGAG